MSPFQTNEDYVAYPTLRLWQHAYYLSMSVDYNTKPDRPHALVTFYPHVSKWKKRQPSGLDQHWHMPLSKWQATMMRDWLNKYLADAYDTPKVTQASNTP